MATEFGVKVTPVFELDSSGFETFKKSLQEKLDSASKDAKLTIKNISFEGDTKDIKGFVNGLQDALGKADFGKSINFGDALSGARQSIDDVAKQLHKIGDSIDYVAGLFSRLSDNGTTGLDAVVSSLQEVNSLISELNQKDFSIQNIFNTGDQGAQKLDAFKSKAVEIMNVLRQMRDASKEFSTREITEFATAFAGTANAETILPFVRGIEALQNIDLTQFSKRLASISDVSSVRDLIADLQRAQGGFEEVYGALRQIGVALPDLDLSGIESATADLERLGRNGAAEQMQQTADAAERLRAALGMGEGVDTASVQSLGNAFEGLKSVLDSIKEKIDTTFDLTSQVEEVAKLGSAYSDLALKMGTVKEGAGITQQPTDTGATQYGAAQIEIIRQSVTQTLSLLDSVNDKISRAYDFTKAIAQISEFRQSLAQIIAMTNALQQNAMATSGKFTTVDIPESMFNNLKSIGQSFAGIGSQLAELKAQIADTFNFEKPMAEADALVAKLQEMRGALQLIKDVARIAQKTQASTDTGAVDTQTDVATQGAVAQVEQVTEALHEATQASEELAATTKQTAEVIKQEFAEAASGTEDEIVPDADEALADETEQVNQLIELYKKLGQAQKNLVNAMGTTRFFCA